MGKTLLNPSIQASLDNIRRLITKLEFTALEITNSQMETELANALAELNEQVTMVTFNHHGI